MPKRAHGRGAVAAIGFLLVFAGLVGGGVLWYLAVQEPDRAADEFARAAPGCTTTVVFTETREYFVYEELSGVASTVEGCEPTTVPGQAFTFVVRTPTGEPVPTVEDTSITYDLDAGQGRSVARIVITRPGGHTVSVVGNDPAVMAAIGPDPEADVAGLRRAAIAAAAVGLVLGGLLLWLAGRRSRRAATFGTPLDPGWGVTERDRERRAAANDETGWSSAPPVGGQVPVNPHQPDERRVAGRPVESDPFDSGWAPPRRPVGVDPAAAPEPPTDIMADPNVESNDESNVESNDESNVDPNDESNDESNVESNDESNVDPNDESNDESNVESNDEAGEVAAPVESPSDVDATAPAAGDGNDDDSNDDDSTERDDSGTY